MSQVLLAGAAVDQELHRHVALNLDDLLLHDPRRADIAAVTRVVTGEITVTNDGRQWTLVDITSHVRCATAPNNPSRYLASGRRGHSLLPAVASQRRPRS
jgi:hypothetical protein